jgi:hypothetical protein
MERQHRPLVLWLLVAILVFIGIGGIATGPILLSDPTGVAIGADLTWLERTPLADWAPVGWFLIVVMGIVPLTIAWGLATRHPWRLAERIDPVRSEHWSWFATLVFGAGLVLWLGLQLALVEMKGGPQVPFAVFAAILLGLPWLPSVRRDLASR